MTRHAGRWDLDRIHAKGYTDNVVELMVGKVNRLPTETQLALQKLACLGNIATVATLSIVLETPEAQVHAMLWPAVRQELVERLEGSYKFIHDRVQEAAYSLIPEESRAAAHLRIGRLLLAQMPPEQREEAIFDIVNQLNRGAALITPREEREQLAELNLIAGKRAKGSSAYASALTYLNAGAALLAEDSWERRHELTFALDLNRAECEFLTGQMQVTEERLAALSKRAATTVEHAIVACLHIDVYTTLDQSGRAVAIGLDYLRHVGIEWSSHPQEDEVRREYERIWSLLGGRQIEDLIDLPLMDDPASLATVEVLIKVLSPARYTDANLAYPDDLQGGQSQPRAWQLRRFKCRLCQARQDRRTAFRRLPGRISIRPARLRPRRTARAKTLRGEDVFRLRDLRRALDETRAGLS